MEEEEFNKFKNWVYQEIIKLQKQIDEIKEKIKERELLGE